jgi:hypothetical protein
VTNSLDVGLAVVIVAPLALKAVPQQGLRGIPLPTLLLADGLADMPNPDLLCCYRLCWTYLALLQC